MNHISNSQIQKGQDVNQSLFQVSINPLNQHCEQTSILLKDMISRSKNDKINQIFNPNRNNVIMQKWSIQESQRNQHNQSKKHQTQDKKDENISPQKQLCPLKERRLSQTSMSRTKEYQTTSPQKNVEDGMNVQQQKQHSEVKSNVQPINDSNKTGTTQKSEVKQPTQKSEVKQVIQIQEAVNKVELHLDTNNRYLENLNRTNYFTERTNSLIEMNKRKKSKQKSQKSPQDNTYIINENQQNNSVVIISDKQDAAKIKRFYEGINSNFFKTHYSNLLTNHRSNDKLIGQENKQLLNEQNSKQLLKKLIVFDHNNSRKEQREDTININNNIRGSYLNKSDNEIRFGKGEEEEDVANKEQNLSLSDVYNASGDKYVKPKRQLLQFPQQEFQQQQHQIPNLQHLRAINNRKPFTSGAQSHTIGGGGGGGGGGGVTHQLPLLRNTAKKNTQSPQKYQKQDLQLNETIYKTQQTLISEYFNKTLTSPPPPHNYKENNLLKDITITSSQIQNAQISHSNHISTLTSEIKNYHPLDPDISLPIQYNQQNLLTQQSQQTQYNQQYQQDQQYKQNQQNQYKYNDQITTSVQNNNEGLVKFCDIGNISENKQEHHKLSQIDFYVGQCNSNSASPLLNNTNAKCNSVNQTRKADSHFIELNKKNLKYLGSKKKSPYNNIVDSIIKQHELKEKDEKKAAQKEKRRKFQQMFKQGEQNNNNLCSLNTQHQFNYQTQKHLSTIGSEFGNCIKNTNATSPEYIQRGNTSLGNRHTSLTNRNTSLTNRNTSLTNRNTSLTNRNTSLTNRNTSQKNRNASSTNRNNTLLEQNIFQPQGMANKNAHNNRDKSNQSPYEQYLEREIELETKRQALQRFQQGNHHPERSTNFFKQGNETCDNWMGNDIKQLDISTSHKKQKSMLHQTNAITKQKQITLEEYINTEQLKNKLLQQQKTTTISTTCKYSPQNYINHINDSNLMVMQNNHLANTITTEQLSMTQNLQKQASLLKKQLKSINYSDQSVFIKNALNNAGQTILHIQKWRGQNYQSNNHDAQIFNEHKKSTTATGNRMKEYHSNNKPSSSECLIIDEDQYSVNYRPKYNHINHDRIDSNHYSSKKKIRNQNHVRVNLSHDFNSIKNRKYDDHYKNEIQPWDTSDQKQYDEEEEDLCGHLL